MTIRWGIIGCGAVCEVKSGPPLYKASGSSLTYVMRRNGDKARDFALRHNVPSYTTNVDEVIYSDQVDAVYVATPPGSHREYAERVARAGKPCYVEKPMARNAAECRSMLSSFEAAGQPLFVAYYRRALPRFVKTKELIDQGELGAVTEVSLRCRRPPKHPAHSGVSNWRTDAEHSGGGLFLDLASHGLDLLDFLFGPVERAHGFAENRLGADLVEDTVVLSLRFSSGVLGIACYDFAAGMIEDQLEIIGSAGSLKMSVFGSEPLELRKETEKRLISVDHPHHVQFPLLQTIVDELNGKGARCPSRGETALRTAILMDDVLSEYYGGREDAFWSRPETWPGRRKR